MLNFTKIKILYKKVVIVIFFLGMIACDWQTACAQDPCGVLDPNEPGCPGDPDIPLDGGLSVLLVAGALYGIKKLKDKRFG